MDFSAGAIKKGCWENAKKFYARKKLIRKVKESPQTMAQNWKLRMPFDAPAAVAEL
jgi:hypothetical protein